MIKINDTTKLIFTIISTILLNCAGYNLVRIPPMISDLKNYEESGIFNRNIGQPMLIFGKVRMQESFVAIDTFKSYTYKNIKVQPGDLWIANYFLIKGKSKGYLLENPDYSEGIHINDSGIVVSGWYSKNTQSPSPWQIDVWPTTKLFERYKPTQSDDSFYGELVYTGIEGKIVNCLYREYINDKMRSVYSMDIKYSIDSDSICRYKGIEFEILEANNKYITFKILKDTEN